MDPASAYGTTRTFRNVRYSVAVGCKADIEQAASKVLNFAEPVKASASAELEIHGGIRLCGRAEDFCSGLFSLRRGAFHSH